MARIQISPEVARQFRTAVYDEANRISPDLTAALGHEPKPRELVESVLDRITLDPEVEKLSMAQLTKLALDAFKPEQRLADRKAKPAPKTTPKETVVLHSRKLKATDDEIREWIRKQPPVRAGLMEKGCKAAGMGTTWKRFKSLYYEVMEGVAIPERAAPGSAKPQVVVDPEVVLERGLSQAQRDVLAFLTMGETLHRIGNLGDPEVNIWVSHDHNYWPLVASKLTVDSDTVRVLLSIDAIYQTHSWSAPDGGAYAITDIGWDLQEETPGDIEQYSKTSSDE